MSALSVRRTFSPAKLNQGPQSSCRQAWLTRRALWFQRHYPPPAFAARNTPANTDTTIQKGLSMTEFAETAMRSMCRNPRCRSKLPMPVSNPTEAFCTRGCHSSFYRTRCRVCECTIEQPKRGQRLVCNKPRCYAAFRRREALGRYHPSGEVQINPKKPTKSSPKSRLTRDPRSNSWLVVAGPPEGITANAYHCAVVGADE